ncbi:putative RNAse III [Tothia fuscella]|uniref:RNAse III n=1 Tax=Tothia fuscella TaxID=1048955 RepID=A0A9P4NPM8_9PEZI|nr:putative RNAse III [Tothia fuscella]
MASSLREVELIIRYEFTDKTLLEEALRAAGSDGPNFGRNTNDGNKRLALVGIAALRTHLAFKGYMSEDARGPIHDRISTVLSNSNLASVCRASGLDKHITRSKCQDFVSDGTRATTVEGLFGAVYKDSQQDSRRVADAAQALGLD